MRNIIKYLFCIVAPIILSPSCKLDKLEDPELYLAYIPITMDWSDSNIDESYTQNISIYFYPIDGGEPYILTSSNLNFAIAKVPIDEYSILIFNDTADDLLGITFDGLTTYSSSIAQVSPLSSSELMYYTPLENDYMVASQDRLALWSMDYFQVTDDMVNFSRSDEFEEYIEALYSRANSRSDNSEAIEISSYFSGDTSIFSLLSEFTDIKPQPSTSVNNIKIRVENLSNAQSIECIARGYVSGVTLSTNKKFTASNRVNSYKFDITSRQYDDGSVDGYITHQFVTFGKESESTNCELVINIIISTGQLYTFERDITDIHNSSDGLNIDILFDEEVEDGEILLPEGQTDDFGVNGWGESEDLELN